MNVRRTILKTHLMNNRSNQRDNQRRCPQDSKTVDHVFLHTSYLGFSLLLFVDSAYNAAIILRGLLLVKFTTALNDLPRTLIKDRGFLRLSPDISIKTRGELTYLFKI